MGSFEGQNQPVPTDQYAERFKKLRNDVALGKFEDVSDEKTATTQSREKKPITPAEKQIEMDFHLERRKSPPIDLTKPLADDSQTENKGWLKEWENNQEEKQKQEHDHN